MLAERSERTKQIKVEVKPYLHRRLKSYTAERDQTMTEYVTQLLEEKLGPEPTEGETQKEETTR